MKNSQLQDIRKIAHRDFDLVKNAINRKQNKITASVNFIRFDPSDNAVTATCEFSFSGTQDVVEASIQYERKGENVVFADSSIDDISDAVLESINNTDSTPIMAADDDEAFVFEDEVEGPQEFEDAAVEEDVVDTDEESSEDSEEDIEDPEEGVDIETDNNIAGHYIAECNRCHGVFISALMESDQHVEFISGVCPLCERESDQYIKWIIKPIED